MSALSNIEFDILARVKFISPENGGRKTLPLNWAYRGQFFFDGTDCDVLHYFNEGEPFSFNEEASDRVVFVNKDNLPFLHEGTLFLIREGKHTIAYGKITELLFSGTMINMAD